MRLLIGAEDAGLLGPPGPSPCLALRPLSLLQKHSLLSAFRPRLLPIRTWHVPFFLLHCPSIPLRLLNPGRACTSRLSQALPELPFRNSPPEPVPPLTGADNPVSGRAASKQSLMQGFGCTWSIEEKGEEGGWGKGRS